MGKKRKEEPRPSNTDVRRWMLQYFYDRNESATSARGKKGSEVKISDIKRELKEQHGLKQQEVQRNLTYLLSQGWIEEKKEERSFKSKGGAAYPSATSYYVITADGIDKIEGEGEFTNPKFHGINIQDSVVTVGDGNQVNVKFVDAGNALSELRSEIMSAGISDTEKLSYVADIETIEAQLVKPVPSSGVLRSVWETLKSAANVEGCAALVERIGGLLGPIFGGGA